jgi:hypothetical protein
MPPVTIRAPVELEDESVALVIEVTPVSVLVPVTERVPSRVPLVASQLPKLFAAVVPKAIMPEDF